MKVYSPVEINTILYNSMNFKELTQLQQYLIDNKSSYSFLYYQETTKKINKKFASTFLNVKYDPIFN